MAKAKTPAKLKSAPTEPVEVVVSYDLFDLPTAFHKAGLAGLILLIDSLKARRRLGADEAKCDLTATTVTVTFTESSIRILMDDLYDAETKLVAVKSKWKDAEVARPPTVAEKEAGTPYVYRIVQPKGTFLKGLFQDEDGLWLKLWRDMLWSIPRGRPTTREPFNQRAEGSTCKEGPNAWNDLLKVQKARTKNGFHTAEVSSALLPGAQAVNAEGVPFEGRAEQNLLLHFWPLTVLLFVPQRIDVDGSSDFAGFTLAVPEVSNLVRFKQHYPRVLSGLSKHPRGYRPAEAVVDLPAEGALAFLDHLATLTTRQVEEQQLRFSIGAVEYLHLIKEGNNVKAMTSGRVAAEKHLLDAYREIVAPDPARGQPPYRNPLFRRGLLLALLNGERWHRPFAAPLMEFNVDLFVRRFRPADEGNEAGPPHFANDAATRFRTEARQFTQKLKRYEDMSEPDRASTPGPKPGLPVIINRVVRSYLTTRSEEKSGVSLKDYRNQEGEVKWDAIPADRLKDFNEAKQKLAQSLFLEFRSRKEQAFVDHFAATFFSVTQRMNEADRLELAEVLIDSRRSEDATRRDDLKTLTLLSLSANS